MDKDQRRLEFYNRCLSYVRSHLPTDRADAVLSQHLDLQDGSQNHVNLSEVYAGLLFSAQNTQGKPNQIGGAIGGIHNLGRITFDFDPHQVAEHYKSGSEIFAQVQAVLRPRGLVNPASSGVWPKYCRTIMEGAAFLAQFKDGADFYGWANSMYQDPRSLDAVPMLISQAVFGVGYNLACDFLKEKGFIEYGKPDVHIQDLLKSVGLCNDKTTDLEYQRELRAIAKVAGVSAYKVDKIVWLVGSGDFYMASPKVPGIIGSKVRFQKIWAAEKGQSVNHAPSLAM